GGGTNIQAKVWLADGTVPEPDDWQLNWGRDGRSGLAGIAASSSTTTGSEEFEVDYVLIKAEGLPSITVSPSAFSGQFSKIPVISITQQPQDVVLDVGQTATFTVAATGLDVPTFQ